MQITEDTLDAIEGTYPDLFMVLSRVYNHKKGIVNIQFRCEQLPAELVGQDVTLMIEKTDDPKKPKLTFRSVYGK